MPCNRVDIAVRELITVFSAVELTDLIDRLARAAAAVASTAYAGFVRVAPLREEASCVHVHGPPGDPLRLRAWLHESGVLKELAVSAAALRLPCDRTVGEPGFLAAPVPASACDHPFVWVAGREFCDADEHLLSRYATAAGRALEAAVRLLRGVRAFRPQPPP